MESRTTQIIYNPYYTMENTDNVLIDILEFIPALPMEYDSVIGRFSSHHWQDCCEMHELCFDETKEYFETAKQFISKVEKIEIK